MIYWYDLTKGPMCSGLFCVCSSRSFRVCKQKVTKGGALEYESVWISVYQDLYFVNTIDSPLCLYCLVTESTVRIDNLLGFFWLEVSIDWPSAWKLMNTNGHLFICTNRFGCCSRLCSYFVRFITSLFWTILQITWDGRCYVYMLNCFGILKVRDIRLRYWGPTYNIQLLE